MRKKLFGTYSALRYSIHNEDGEELYMAGNSPYDSQGYVRAEDGVGLEVMREYCNITGREMAAEMGAEWMGADKDGEEEEE